MCYSKNPSLFEPVLVVDTDQSLEFQHSNGMLPVLLVEIELGRHQVALVRLHVAKAKNVPNFMQRRIPERMRRQIQLGLAISMKYERRKIYPGIHLLARLLFYGCICSCLGRIVRKFLIAV